MVAAILIAPGLLSGDTITQWNFNSVVPDGNTATGSSIPNIGTGVISAIGGAVNTGFNSGVGSSDSAAAADNSGYQTGTYPAQGNASGTAGVRFSLSTLGFQNIGGSFDLRTSNTSSRWYQVRYTADGVNFLDLNAPVRLGVGDVSVGDQWSNSLSFDLSSISGVNNNANFGLEIVSVFSPIAFTEFLGGTNFGANVAYEAARNVSTGTQSIYAGGTWRFDMATFSGNAVPEASSMAVIALVGLGFTVRPRARS